MVRWITTLSWWRAVWSEPKNVSSPLERCGFGFEKLKLNRPYKKSSEWNHPVTALPHSLCWSTHLASPERPSSSNSSTPPPNLATDASRLPRRRELLWWVWEANCCVNIVFFSPFFKQESPYFNSYFWFTCRGHWRRMPLNQGHRLWQRKPEKNIQQNCPKCFGKSSVLGFWKCICCNSHLQFNITNKQNACFESFLFLWPFKKTWTANFIFSHFHSQLKLINQQQHLWTRKWSDGQFSSDAVYTCETSYCNAAKMSTFFLPVQYLLSTLAINT